MLSMSRWLIRCLLLLWHIYSGLSDGGSGDDDTYDDRLYPFGPKHYDEQVPNTDEYIEKCFMLNISKDEINFRGNIFNVLFICRNGMVRFKNHNLQHLPINFGLHSGQQSDPVITPYWSRANTNESFSADYSTIHYHVYTNRTSSNKTIFNLAEEDIYKVYGYVLSVDCVIVITWRCLRPENHGLDLENTFQLVLIKIGCKLFAIFNYGTLEWSVPAPRSQISLWTDYIGKPVLGWNAGLIGNNHKFYNIKHFSGTLNADLIEDSEGSLGKGRWIFPIGGCEQQAAAILCLVWQALEPTINQISLNSTFTCPCTLAQIQSDGRFFKENITTLYNKTCYLSNIHINGHGQRCCFSLALGSLITDLPHAGSALRYHPKYFPIAYYQHDQSGYHFCCESSNLCNAYFDRRQIGNCINYTAPTMGLAFGDPHFRTFDGQSYTFNGVGEFILTTSSVFEVQIRTQLIGNTTEVAVRSVVVWETNSPSIQISLANTEPFSVEVDGALFSGLEYLTDVPFLIGGRIAISRPYRDCILVAYPLGNSIKVTKIIDSLSVIVALTNRLGEGQKGLLGLLNDDKNDDFTLRDNSHLNSTDSDDEQVHYKFGLNWQVSSNESLFNYKNGTNVSTFALQNFVPIFASSFTLQQRNTASILCDGEKSCIYDYLTRNSSDVGLLTLKTLRNFNHTLLTLNNMPPKINFQRELYLTLGETFLFDITTEDDDDKPIFLSVSGFPEMEEVESLNGSLYFNWTVKTIEKFQLQIVATDSNKASTILTPTIKICACQNEGKCFQDLNSTEKSFIFYEFYIMNCSCPQNVNGRLCENSPADLCSDGSGSPCFPGLECQNTKNGIKCGECPLGYVGDGITCKDIDECLNENGGCDQICENKPGSYHCRCQSRFNQGYKLAKNGKTCEDIDECTKNASDCQQKCDNTVGSFSCSCYENFNIDSTNSKQCISATPCPRINKCQQQCHKTEAQEVCSCNNGYRLEPDGIHCIDLNECAEHSSGCQHSCENSQGSFNCLCLPGYKHDIDGKTCRDYDECTESLGSCDSTKGQRCVNLVGGFKCECDRKMGFYKINDTCQGISGKNSIKEKLDEAYILPGYNNKTSVRVLIKNQQLSQWTLEIHTTFRQVIAEAVTDYCSTSFAKRSYCGVAEYGKVDFNELHVNRLPGYPKQEDKDLIILIYVRYPEGIKLKNRENPSKLPRPTLQQILKEYKQFIEDALDVKIAVPGSRDEDLAEEPQSSPSRSSSNKILVISLSVAGTLLLIAVISGLVMRGINVRKTKVVSKFSNATSSENIDDLYATLHDVPPLY